MAFFMNWPLPNLQNICGCINTVDDLDPDTLNLKDINWFRKTDLGPIPTEVVLRLLKTKTEGLSANEAAHRQELFGENNSTAKFRLDSLVDYFISIMLLASMILAGIIEDWIVFGMMLVFLLGNPLLVLLSQHYFPNPLPSVWADNVAPHSIVFRGDVSQNIESRLLVPGDVICVKTGSFVSADCMVIEQHELQVDETPMGGLSGIHKGVQHLLYYGSFCTSGEARALVIATGVNTKFQKERTKEVSSHTQKLVHDVNVLLCLYLCIMTMVFGCVLFAVKRRPLLNVVRTLSSFLAGSIPIAFASVHRAILNKGSHQLHQKRVFFKNLAVLEKMAQIDVLCLDKKSLVSDMLLVDESSIRSFDRDSSKLDVLNFVYSQSTVTESRHIKHLPLSVLTTTPRSDNMCMGDTEFVLKECDGIDEQKIKEVRETVKKFSDHGFHSLAVATKQADGKWKFICILPLFEPPLPQVPGILKKLCNLGVDVKIVTTDSLTLAKMVGKRIGIGANILPPCVFYTGYSDPSRAALPLKKLVETSSGFCEVSLEDKISMLDAFRDGEHICGFTGVVDADTTVLRNADVGIISLSDATQRARICCDMALSDHGIASIFKAVITGRKIFYQSKTITSYVILNVFYIGLSALLLDLIWNIKIPSYLIMVIVFCNYLTVACTLYAEAKPSLSPKNLKPRLVTGGALTGLLIGLYLTGMTLLFFVLSKHVHVFPSIVKVTPLKKSTTTAIYLQMSYISQASILVISQQNLSWKLRNLIFPVIFVVVQLTITLTSANEHVFGTRHIHKSWVVAICCYSFLVYVPLYVIKVVFESIVFGKLICHTKDKSLTLDD